MYVDQLLEVIRLFDFRTTFCLQVNGEDIYVSDLKNKYGTNIIKSIHVYTRVDNYTTEDIIKDLECLNPDSFLEFGSLGVRNMFYDIIIFNIII